MKKHWLAPLVIFALLMINMGTALANTPSYTEIWDGRGSDSLNCTMPDASDPRYEFLDSGWIHWVFSTKGDSTDALLKLSGSGSGEYSPGEPLNANIWHFYTPYFDVNDLEASIELFGGDPGPGGGLVISDYCPGSSDFENLDVTKTADTSFSRTHFWDIAKNVETGFTHNGYPKIWLYIPGQGDDFPSAGAATWTVDVTYEGYEDAGFNVYGDIFIDNTGTLDAVITAVDDVLGGAPIAVDCGVEFPYTLPAGESLTCSYSEDGYFEGFNEVTVTTERDEYFAEAEIIWGAPTTEVNDTVNIKDISDLFGEVDLGSVSAPNDASFTYSHEFKWEDYGANLCGDYRYDNTATIVETGQSASATLLVNVQCYIYETAYAKGGSAICFIPTFSNWGWTNPITPGEYTWDLWAAAGQCDTSKGTLVGSVTVVYAANGFVTVTYNVNAPYLLVETHVYAGTTMFPLFKGKPTVAPGRYYNASPFKGGQVYVIAHAVVGIPDPNFGP